MINTSRSSLLRFFLSKKSTTAQLFSSAIRYICNRSR